MGMRIATGTGRTGNDMRFARSATGFLWCVGEGLCPSRGRPQGSPLRKGYKKCGAVRNPPVTASPCQPPLGKGAGGTGVADCEASVRTGFAMTEAERICVSFRDQSADWSWGAN